MRSNPRAEWNAVILSEAKDPTWQHGRWQADEWSRVERPRYHVYIVTDRSLSRVFVTSELPARMDAHRRRKADGFTALYPHWRLVCAEACT
jgi:hypothetical protein